MTTSRDDIDLLDPEFYVGDPHPAHRWMRQNEPVFRDEKNELWGITTMEDIRKVEEELKDLKGVVKDFSEFVERIVIPSTSASTDPPPKSAA